MKKYPMKPGDHGQQPPTPAQPTRQRFNLGQPAQKKKK
jgi:hypothetical protein